MNTLLEKVEIEKTFSSWIIEMPSDIAKQEGYTEGSKVVLTFQNGKVKSQVLPPTTDAVKNEVKRIIGKYDDAFRELKRLGD